MFGEIFVDDNQQKQRCDECEYKHIVHASGGFSFNGCYCGPYTGMWVANIKGCPKEMENK